MLNTAKCLMPIEKIRDFLLRPGAKHSNEFFDVGYTVYDVEKLNQDIYEIFDEENAVDVKIFDDGKEKFCIFMELCVLKKRRFRTVWQKDTPNSKPRFIKV